MAVKYIELTDDTKWAGSSVAVSGLLTLQEYLELVDGVLYPQTITVPAQSSNWYITQNPKSGYFLLSAFITSDTGDYYVTGFNMRTGNTGKYTLFFNKTLGSSVQITLLWGKVLAMI